MFPAGQVFAVEELFPFFSLSRGLGLRRNNQQHERQGHKCEAGQPGISSLLGKWIEEYTPKWRMAARAKSFVLWVLRSHFRIIATATCGLHGRKYLAL